MFGEVAAGDFDELAELRIEAMHASLERVGRFDPERARERLRRSFIPEHTRWIVMKGKRVGFYALRPVEGALHLDHVYVHPRWQSQGVGSRVMRQLTAVADEKRLPIHLGALRESAANRFYQRQWLCAERGG